MLRTFLIVATVAAAALAATAAFVLRPGQDDAFAQCRATAVSGGTDAIGGAFTLVDETGRTVTDADVLAQPSLIYFGYTFCPDDCPLDASRNAEAVELLEERGKIVQPVFISIDPERDTPEVLADFTSYLHPRMLGLTGSAEQVQQASRAYKTYYRRQDTDDEYYLVDHSTFTYLTLPGVGFVEYFRRDDTAREMADRVACFLDAAG